MATEREKAEIRQSVIRSHANTSIAMLEKGFVQNGSGRYLVLRATDMDVALRRREKLSGKVEKKA